MTKCTTLRAAVVSSFLISNVALSQPNNNGQLDMTEEFTTRYTVPFTMPDGIKLMTDIYLPIVRDCLMVDVDDTVPLFLFDVPVKTKLEIIPKNTQIIVYDSLYPNGISNPGIRNSNFYELPMVFTRTPYSKAGGYNVCTGAYDNVGEGDAAGAMMSLLGYGYIFQDMRGRYSSEGVYLPMYSDSWKKSAYHPGYTHPGDVLYYNNPSSTDPLNSNNHEDGYWSIRFINDSLTDQLLAKYGLKPPVTGYVCNGSLGMLGGSALGNTQLQAAGAHPIDPNGRGLKGLLPIVASLEHYRFTGYQNGVFRERIITGWLKGQIMDLTDPEECLEDYGININDNEKQNTIHTPADYNLSDKFKVADIVTDYWTTYVHGGYSAAYPNSIGRPEMDGSRAFVDANGDGAANGPYSRYGNMRVPIYHLTGWWDIFTDGQIETMHYTRWAMDSLYRKTGDPFFLKLKNQQKIVIGPWAHQTIGQKRTGEKDYPDNVTEITKLDPDEVDLNNLPINEALESEFITWFRHTLNYNSYKTIGEPKFFIPESQKWQFLGTYNYMPGQTDTLLVRIPADPSDTNFIGYSVRFIDFFNFLNGTGGLAAFPVEIKSTVFGWTVPFSFDVPATGTATLPGIDSTPINQINVPDFSTEISPFRFYFIGPYQDGVPENSDYGNFWFSSDTFPLVNNIRNTPLYLQYDYSLKLNAPSNTSDNYVIYVHDPDDPVKTVGGANMIVKHPNGDGRNSQGQMILSDPSVVNLTMDREGVVKFETAPLDTPISVIGFPVATLWAKTAPAGTVNGLTETDFNVRIIDVYPDGKEYFVVEGCVNAKARNYARKMVEDPMSEFRYVIGSDGKPFFPADTIAFSNVKANQLYEYKFKMMPLAYIWGKNHKMKILISSSNHPRYQSNPNLPMEQGEFFRRIPLDGKSYNYGGTNMYARKAVQRIAISSAHPSRIELPVYTGNILGDEEAMTEKPVAYATVYPNPATRSFNIHMNRYSDYDIVISNMVGQKVYSGKFKQSLNVPVKDYETGVYFIDITEKPSMKTWRRKLVVM